MIAKVIAEADISTVLDRRIKEGLCASFPENKDFFAKSRYWNGVAPEFSIVGMEGENVIGYIAVISREIQVGSNTMLSIFGIQNVFVLPEYRGKGVLDIIMDKTLNESGKRNYDCGLLFCMPVLEKIYVRSGWKTLKNVSVFEMDEKGIRIPKTKGICMYYPGGISQFPKGDINLMGKSW